MKQGLFALAFVFVAHAAAGQTSGPRVYLAIGGLSQTFKSDTFDQSATPTWNAEQGSLDIHYDLPRAVGFDIAGGVFVKPVLAIGVGLTRVSHEAGTSIQASIPHPFFFDRPRAVSGTARAIMRDETAVHIQMRGIFPVGTRLQVSVFGGPTFFSVAQDIVTGISISDTYPYDEATLGDVNTTHVTQSTTGYDVGGDVSVFVTRQVGVGFAATMTGATFEAPTPAGDTHNLDAGGVQLSGGIRLRF